MTIGGYNVAKVVLACGLGIALIVGGYHLWQWQAVDRPVTESIESMADVSSYEFVTSPEPALKVELTSDADMSSSVQMLEQILHRYRAGTELVITDQRTPELGAALDEIRFQLEEGLMTGEFTLMIHRVASTLADDVDWDLAVDDQYLYVRLANADGLLYELIRRPVQER